MIHPITCDNCKEEIPTALATGRLIPGYGSILKVHYPHFFTDEETGKVYKPAPIVFHFCGMNCESEQIAKRDKDHYDKGYLGVVWDEGDDTG